MATELEKREQSLAIPNVETGELVDLSTAETDQIAEAVWSIREAESRYREWKRAAGEELLRRMDADASWSMHVGQYDIKGESPAPSKEVDLIPLRDELLALVQEGWITDKAAANAIEEVVTYKLKWGGLNAIRKLGDAIRERIDQHIREVEKVRRMPSVNLVRPEPPK